MATILSSSVSYVTVVRNTAKNLSMAAESYMVLNEKAVSELTVKMDL